ncbi:hypothetical protein BAU29_07340 [Bacillus sp. P14-1]|nr:hypothetical protein BAU29_07340 [Bacillus sp. P14-1]
MKKILFFYCLAPVARLFGGCASSCKAKGAFTSEAPSPSQSERAACAFYYDPAPAARTVGHFTPSLEAKGASSSGVPMPSCSERAACAFHFLAPPPSPSCLRTFRTRRQKASSVRKNLSQQG